MIEKLNKIYHKYIDIQYRILLKIFLFLFPKETPQSTDVKISKIKANSLYLMKKFPLANLLFLYSK